MFLDFYNQVKYLFDRFAGFNACPQLFGTFAKRKFGFPYQEKLGVV